MGKLSTDELLDAFKEMTLIELSEFVKQFEEVFNVTAAARDAACAAINTGRKSSSSIKAFHLSRSSRVMPMAP